MQRSPQVHCYCHLYKICWAESNFHFLLQTQNHGNSVIDTCYIINLARCTISIVISLPQTVWNSNPFCFPNFREQTCCPSGPHFLFVSVFLKKRIVLNSALPIFLKDGLSYSMKDENTVIFPSNEFCTFRVMVPY